VTGLPDQAVADATDPVTGLPDQAVADATDPVTGLQMIPGVFAQAKGRPFSPGARRSGSIHALGEGSIVASSQRADQKF
jgi:hypothetical protein